MIKNIPRSCQVITYGLNSIADVKAVSWKTELNGTTIEVDSLWGKFHLAIQSLGRFNIYNSLAVLASLLASQNLTGNRFNLQSSNLDSAKITDLMKQLKPSPGRLEIVAEKPSVLVDYAHTPDALQNVLEMLTTIKQNKIWVIFGCGGDRDKTKRPLMGKIASEYADNIVITNDNPRTENPEVIISEILKGIKKDIECWQISDRKEAIEYVLKHAETDDIVLIAGKGHENYQIIGAQTLHFSDQEVVKNFFASVI